MQTPTDARHSVTDISVQLANHHHVVEHATSLHLHLLKHRILQARYGRVCVGIGKERSPQIPAGGIGVMPNTSQCQITRSTRFAQHV